MKKGIIYFTMIGYSDAREFYVPGFRSDTKIADPDIRKTIYWDPNVKTDSFGNATVEFDNFSGVSDYAVIIEGVSNKGDLGSSKFKF